MTNEPLTRSILKRKWKMFEGMGYPKAKWIEFSEILLKEDYELYIYEARKTFSKYITVMKDDKKFKVRFSNHKPIAHRELSNDCDFFVGVTNLKVTNTNMALKAVMEFFNND